MKILLKLSLLVTLKAYFLLCILKKWQASTSRSWFYACFQGGKEGIRKRQYNPRNPTNFQNFNGVNIPSKRKAKIRFSKVLFLHTKNQVRFCTTKKGGKIQSCFFYFSAFLNHFKVLIEKKDLIPQIIYIYIYIPLQLHNRMIAPQMLSILKINESAKSLRNYKGCHFARKLRKKLQIYIL